MLRRLINQVPRLQNPATYLHRVPRSILNYGNKIGPAAGECSGASCISLKLTFNPSADA
jgi:hypothetical protein